MLERSIAAVSRYESAGDPGALMDEHTRALAGEAMMNVLRLADVSGDRWGTQVDTELATQAHTVIAAAILCQLHAIITTGTPWDPRVAAGGIAHHRDLALAA